MSTSSVESRIQMPVRLPVDLYNELRSRAGDKRQSMNKLVTEALFDFLTRPEVAERVGMA